MRRIAAKPAVVALAALLYAGLATASGFDRYSAHVPGAARLVPAPFQAEAAKVAAAAALVRGETTKASVLAERALRRAPLDAQAVDLVAQVRGMSGEPARGEDALRVANLLGWREAGAQLHLFMASLENGAYPQAAYRIDAMLRTRANEDTVNTMLAALEATPAGRAELAGRLATAPHWAAAYLSAFDSDDGVLRQRAALLASPQAAQVRLGCDAVAPMIEALAARAYRGEAEALARQQCPARASPTRVIDPDFVRYADSDASALGWRRQASGDVRVTPVERGVEIANSASVTRLVLTQPVALRAGAYRLAARVGGLDPSLFVATLGCGLPGEPEHAGGASQLLTARGCANEVLGLWLRPGQGALTLSGITLTPR